MIWEAAGSPAVDACRLVEGSCWYCGAEMTRGQDVRQWAGSGFNAYNRALRRSDTGATDICEACVSVCSRISPVPGRPPKPGKKYGGNYRNYSHGAARMGDGSVRYINTTKAETPAMVDFILDPGGLEWAVALATSGQKHVIPHAPTNGSGDTAIIAFEDLAIRFSRREFKVVNAEMNALRQSSGCSVAAITTGEYHPKDLSRDLDGVQAFERRRGSMRGGGVFEMCAFLTCKGVDQ